jgi:hypothetical protein
MGKVVMGGGGAEAAAANDNVLCTVEHYASGSAGVSGRSALREGLERTGEVVSGQQWSTAQLQENAALDGV